MTKNEDRAVRFVAPDGTYWSVHEITEHRSAAVGRALIFVSDAGFRRVRHFPEDWRTLGPHELFELSWSR